MHLWHYVRHFNIESHISSFQQGFSLPFGSVLFPAFRYFWQWVICEFKFNKNCVGKYPVISAWYKFFWLRFWQEWWAVYGTVQRGVRNLEKEFSEIHGGEVSYKIYYVKIYYGRNFTFCGTDTYWLRPLVNAWISGNSPLKLHPVLLLNKIRFRVWNVYMALLVKCLHYYIIQNSNPLTFRIMWRNLQVV